MCRFTLYKGTPLTLANLITEPVNSLINQSLRARQQDDPMNGDGFGVAWYAPDITAEPAVFRSVTPAWNNMNLVNLSRVTRSGCILAHVRRATPGLPTAELNCHPFTHGPFAFMHNGELDGFMAIRRVLVESLSDEGFAAINGNTDSEHLFAVFLDEMRALGGHHPGEPRTAALMAEALESTIRRAVGLAREAGAENGETFLNIAISDGVRSVACRYSTADPSAALSLHIHHGRRYVCEKGVCRMVSPEKGRGAVIISSEPLSDDAGWQAVPFNCLVMVNEDLTVSQRPIAAIG